MFREDKNHGMAEEKGKKDFQFKCLTQNLASAGRVVYNNEFCSSGQSCKIVLHVPEKMKPPNTQNSK